MTPRYDISGEIGMGPNTSAEVGRFLNANPGPVDIFVNSYGGFAHEGAGIFAALDRHGAATAIVQGMAASAASLLMLGARRVLIHDGTVVMIHDPQAFVAGNSAAIRDAANTLDKIGGIYARLYSRATGHPQKRIEAWMRAETWMTAEEAVALNFADEIAKDDGAQPCAVAAYDYRKFRAAPPELVRLTLQNGWANASPETETNEAKQ